MILKNDKKNIQKTNMTSSFQNKLLLSLDSKISNFHKAHLILVFHRTANKSENLRS